MATSGQDTAADTSTMFFCRLCTSVYRQAKLLPCLHSFCTNCLEDAVVTRGTQGKPDTLECPVCDHQCSIPPATSPDSLIKSLPDNSFLDRLCREYVAQVQTNLVAARGAHVQSPDSRSVSSSASDPHSASPTNSVSTAITSVGESVTEADDPTSPRARHRPNSVSDNEVFRPPVAAVDRGRTSGANTTAALESIRNMSRLQGKIMWLQGEALKVTYAVEEVNQGIMEWHQHKEDIKKAVERRSAQFQFFIKRLERQLIHQIDAKGTEDELYAQADRTKGSLRHILRNILHEVAVLKGVQELGQDAEINQLAATLLGTSAAMKGVELDKVHYNMDVPVRSIEEVIEAGFGKLALVKETGSVFKPDILEFTAASAGTVVPGGVEFNASDDVKIKQTLENAQEKSFGITSPLTKQSEVPSRRKKRESRRHMTDLGLQSEEVKTFLQQFQDARESLKDKRREILRQGQLARQEPPVMRTDLIKVERVRSSSRSRRGQSVERKADQPLGKPAHQFRRASVDDGTADGASNPPPEPLVKFQFGAGASHHVVHSLRGEELNVPSPVLEETSPGSTPRKSFQQSPLAAPPKERIASPEEASGSELLSEQITSTISETVPSSDRHGSLDSVSPSSSPSSTPPEYVSLDLRSRRKKGEDGITVRRAISNVADKRSKMEFLRENWQRRKELLKQTEGFVSPDTTKSPSSPSSDRKTKTKSSPQVSPAAGQRRSPTPGTKSNLEHSKDAVSSINTEEKEETKVETFVVPKPISGRQLTFAPRTATAKLSHQVDMPKKETSSATSFSRTETKAVTAISSSSNGTTLSKDKALSEDSDSEQETVYTEVISIPAPGSSVQNSSAKPGEITASTKPAEVTATSSHTVTSDARNLSSQSSTQSSESSSSSYLTRHQRRYMSPDTQPTTTTTTNQTAPSTETKTETVTTSSSGDSYLTRMQRRYMSPESSASRTQSSPNENQIRTTTEVTKTETLPTSSTGDSYMTRVQRRYIAPESSSSVTKSSSNNNQTETATVLTKTETIPITSSYLTRMQRRYMAPDSTSSSTATTTTADTTTSSIITTTQNRYMPQDRSTTSLSTTTTTTIPSGQASIQNQTQGQSTSTESKSTTSRILSQVPDTSSYRSSVMSRIQSRYGILPTETAPPKQGPSTTTTMQPDTTTTSFRTVTSTTSPTPDPERTTRPSTDPTTRLVSQTAEETTTTTTIIDPPTTSRARPPALRLGSKHGSLQEDSPQDMSGMASTTATRSPGGDDRSPTGSPKDRMREIARKKRERWRHLTIT